MNGCTFEERLTPFLLGDLPAAEADVVRQHLAECAACRAAAAQLGPTLAALQSALAADRANTPRLTPQRRRRVLAARPPNRAIFWLRASHPLLRLAAGLVLIAGVAALFVTSQKGGPYRVPQGRGEECALACMEIERADQPATGPAWVTMGDSYRASGSDGKDVSGSEGVSIHNSVTDGEPVPVRVQRKRNKVRGDESDDGLEQPPGGTAGKLMRELGWEAERGSLDVGGTTRPQSPKPESAPADPFSAPPPPLSMPAESAAATARPAPAKPRAASGKAGDKVTDSSFVFYNVLEKAQAESLEEGRPTDASGRLGAVGGWVADGEKRSKAAEASYDREVVNGTVDLPARGATSQAGGVAAPADAARSDLTYGSGAAAPVPATTAPAKDANYGFGLAASRLEPPAPGATARADQLAAKPKLPAHDTNGRTFELDELGPFDRVRATQSPVLMRQRHSEDSSERKQVSSKLPEQSHKDIEVEVSFAEGSEHEATSLERQAGEAADQLRRAPTPPPPEAPRSVAAPVSAALPKPPPPPPANDPAPPPQPVPPAAHNPFVETAANPFSTFAIDVDTASYTLTRQALLSGHLPEPEQVRTEEIVNAFDYGDAAALHGTFRIYVEGAPSPFGPELTLLRVGIKGRRLGREEQRPAMLTFLVDTSGSMAQPDRIGLARQSLALLLEQLAPQDQLQLVAYDDHARLVLEATAAGERAAILAAFDRLQCTGSTNLEAGMRLAYEAAARAFRPGGESRVILISDGVANLGSATAGDILNTIQDFRRQGITCSVFGVGRGSYNDRLLEELANRGDGAYRFLDSEAEVRQAFVDDLAATLNTIASDVKIQVEWNPAAVARYRQLGYENRALTAQQFRDDSVDAGEVGSGQSVTALYELARTDAADRNLPLGTVRVRYRRTDNRGIEELAQPITASMLSAAVDAARPELRLAAAAAEFAEQLRRSPYAAGSQFEDVARLLRPVALALPLDTRVRELLQLAEQAQAIAR